MSRMENPSQPGLTLRDDAAEQKDKALIRKVRPRSEPALAAEKIKERQ
jgi:hypothetical protein